MTFDPRKGPPWLCKAHSRLRPPSNAVAFLQRYLHPVASFQPLSHAHSILPAALQDSSNPAARKLERDFPTGFNTSPVNVGYKQEKESLPSREAARQTTRRKQRSVLELNPVVAASRTTCGHGARVKANTEMNGSAAAAPYWDPRPATLEQCATPRDANRTNPRARHSQAVTAPDYGARATHVRARVLSSGGWAGGAADAAYPVVVQHACLGKKIRACARGRGGHLRWTLRNAWMYTRPALARPSPPSGDEQEHLLGLKRDTDMARIGGGGENEPSWKRETALAKLSSLIRRTSRDSLLPSWASSVAASTFAHFGCLKPTTTTTSLRATTWPRSLGSDAARDRLCRRRRRRCCRLLIHCRSSRSNIRVIFLLCELACRLTLQRWLISYCIATVPKLSFSFSDSHCTLLQH
ncbi:hypothetical protein GGX14DRAFT_391251 [Mycena pura]|uniref:Uncharacterized protein n=1 Tax=Mycena pura TaxID=153505 RepID=A0AAD6VLA5_9AGAR|nr:hypothetical protein GGX14DRAFT_391251 [Mycena pura]